MEEVTSGTVKVSMKYGTIPLVDESLDLCDLVTQVNMKCPLAKGPFNLDLKEDIPDYVPSVSNLFILYKELTFIWIHNYTTIQGDYSGNATISDQNGKELACLSITLSV